MAEEKNGGDNYSEIIGDARGVGKHDSIVVGYHVFSFWNMIFGLMNISTEWEPCGWMKLFCQFFV